MWSLFSKASSFPYDKLDEIYQEETTLWKLHKGKSKKSGEDVSIFLCDGSAAEIEAAKLCAKQIKIFKHPSMLKFIDSYETDKSIYVVSEVVYPLLEWMKNKAKNLEKLKINGLISWGLLSITEGLSFISNDAHLSHNNINSSSIFVTRGGEWKLFGFEYICAENSIIPNKIHSHLLKYNPPEVSSSRLAKNIWACDTWGLGCLIWEVFNQQKLDKSLSLQHTSKIPKELLPTYYELVGANPLSRPNPKDILEKLSEKGRLFDHSLIKTIKFLDQIQLKDDAERSRFFSSLPKQLDNIPDFISKHKILPTLLTTNEILNAGSVLLTPIFKIGCTLDEQEYQSHIVPCVVSMFNSTDRSTRLKLLKEMENLATHLDAKTINDQIFQSLVTGFSDTNPTIREHTIKAILYLAPKLNFQNLNTEIMKHFAKVLGKDDQGGIRTNTTVCLGKIAPYLDPATRQKCLSSAFTRATHDSFPPTRIAGVTAFGATQQYYPMSEVAMKILPALSRLTIDPDKPVRDAAFKIIQGFLGKLQKVSDDPDLKEELEKEVASSTAATQVSSWAGWAVGTLASHFYKGPPKSEVKDNRTATKNEEASLNENLSKNNKTVSQKSDSMTSSGDASAWSEEDEIKWENLDISEDEIEPKSHDYKEKCGAFAPQKSEAAVKSGATISKKCDDTFDDPFFENFEKKSRNKKDEVSKSNEVEIDPLASVRSFNFTEPKKRTPKSGPMKLGVRKQL